MVKGCDVSSPFEKFYKEVTPKFRNHLHTFGEVAIVKNHARQIKSKLEDRGIPCTFLGYAEDHAGDVFRFMNMNTEQLIMSRDAKWLDKMYGDYKQIKDPVITFMNVNVITPTVHLKQISRQINQVHQL